MQSLGLNLVHPGGSSDLALAKTLEGLRAAGAEFAEVAPHRLGAILGGRLVGERTEALRAVLGGAGLGYTVHAADRLNLMDTQRPQLQLDIFRSTLEFAARIGAMVVVYHSGQRVGARDARHSLSAQLAAERTALWEMGEVAGELGITIAVENSYPDPAILHGAAYAYGAWPSQLAEQVAAVDHSAVGICLDLGHGWIASSFFGFDFLQECAVAAPLVRHLHIHDNLGQPDFGDEPEACERITRGLGDLHLPPGSGNVPIEAALSLLDLSRIRTSCVELSANSYHQAAEALQSARQLARPGAVTAAA